MGEIADRVEGEGGREGKLILRDIVAADLPEEVLHAPPLRERDGETAFRRVQNFFG